MVYFGGIKKYKKPEEVVSILWSVHEIFPNSNSTTIGSGAWTIQVKVLLDSNDLNDSVNFTGRIPDEQLSAIVSSSWSNLHTSQTEGWGNSILEASASGTPTVSYSVPDVVDAIEDGMNGFKVKDNCRESFLDAVLGILKEPKSLWESSRRVAEKYSWDDTARRWDEVIREVVEND